MEKLILNPDMAAKMHKKHKKLNLKYCNFNMLPSTLNLEPLAQIWINYEFH